MEPDDLPHFTSFEELMYGYNRYEREQSYKENFIQKLKPIVLKFHFEFTLSKDNIPGTNVFDWFDNWIKQQQF